MNTSQKQGVSNNARHEKSSRLSTFKRLTVITVVGLAAALSVFSVASASKVAYITDGDMTYSVDTYDTDTSGILEKAGIELSEYDEAIVTEESSERIDINILRAFSVKVTTSNGARFLSITGGTVADALAKTDVYISANDFITPDKSTELTDGMEIKVVKGVKVYLTCDGATNIVYVPQGKVKDALDYVGYQLSEDDDVSVDLDADVESGMRISVDRVEYKDTYEKIPIKHTVVEEASANLPLGERQIKQKGKDGLLQITTAEKYVNGELVSSEEKSHDVLKKAVDEIVLVGTKQEEVPVVNTFAEFTAADESDSNSNEDSVQTGGNVFGTSYDSNGNQLSYSTMMTGTCTAYYEPGGITSTGTVPKIGTVAVNPNVIPYGTRLYICSADGSFVYGYAVAEDTGGACMAGDIVLDLYMESEEACNAFGRRELNIYILN